MTNLAKNTADVENRTWVRFPFLTFVADEILHYAHIYWDRTSITELFVFLFDTLLVFIRLQRSNIFVPTINIITALQKVDYNCETQYDALVSSQGQHQPLIPLNRMSPLDIFTLHDALKPKPPTSITVNIVATINSFSLRYCDTNTTTNKLRTCFLCEF